MPSLMLGFALECIRPLASSSELVLILLGHGSFAASWRPDLPTLAPAGIYPRSLVVSTGLVYAITLKQPLLTLLPVQHRPF